MRKYLILFLVFSIIGHLISFYFYEYSLKQIIDVERIGFYNNWFPVNFIFSFSIGILPMFYLFYRKLSIRISIFRITSLYITSLIMGSLLWQIKIRGINEDLKLNPKKIIDFDDLNLELFWIIGLISGALLCLGLFKYSDKRNKNIC